MHLTIYWVSKKKLGLLIELLVLINKTSRNASWACSSSRVQRGDRGDGPSHPLGAGQFMPLVACKGRLAGPAASLPLSLSFPPVGDEAGAVGGGERWAGGGRGGGWCQSTIDPSQWSLFCRIITFYIRILMANSSNNLIAHFNFLEWGKNKCVFFISLMRAKKWLFSVQKLLAEPPWH